MKERIKKYLPAAGTLLVICLLGFLAIWLKKEKEQPEVRETVNSYTDKKSLYAGSANWREQNLSEEDRQAMVRAFTIYEQKVHTFLQGPKSWSEGIPWSGEWCQFSVEGNPFGGFGCGLCCMANIYNTLSPYEVSPWDMFEYAVSSSSYAPDGRYGAIDWKEMRHVLRKCGVRCKLYRKPETYEMFQEQMKTLKSAVVLITSAEDDTYWQNTPGHYVNIWLYQEEDDTVFLAEPGNPENNRSRIPLRYIYDALKTVSRFQYLAVEGYLEEDNQWKAHGIDENWNRPSELQ